MSLYKRGRIWWYSFEFKGRRYQGSTNQTNIRNARQVEDVERANVGFAAHGIGALKAAPIFSDFMESTFLDFVDRHSKKPKTATFYRERTRRLMSFEAWKELRLSDIDGELIEKYISHRTKTVSAYSINGELATLRKALKLAEEWKLVRRAPKVRLLPRPKGRDFVVGRDLEAAYLSIAPYPLKQVAILMLDTGCRPEEVVRIRKTDISDVALIVREGKSDNAARTLPLTGRAIETIEFVKALWPNSEWLLPGRKGSHLRSGSLDAMHASVRAELVARTSGAHAGPNMEASLMPADANAFVLYSFRHSYATRLAESGASPYDIAKLLGHADIRMTSRYTHPTSESLTLAVKRLEAMNRTMSGEVPTNSPIATRK